MHGLETRATVTPLNAAVFKMLDDLGVEPENIAYDDFGG